VQIQRERNLTPSLKIPPEIAALMMCKERVFPERKNGTLDKDSRILLHVLEASTRPKRGGKGRGVSEGVKGYGYKMTPVTGKKGKTIYRSMQGSWTNL